MTSFCVNIRMCLGGSVAEWSKVPPKKESRNENHKDPRFVWPWLWRSWQSGRFRHQRSADRTPTSARFFQLSAVICIEKTKTKGQEAGNGPFKKKCNKIIVLWVDRLKSRQKLLKVGQYIIVNSVLTSEPRFPRFDSDSVTNNYDKNVYQSLGIAEVERWLPLTSVVRSSSLTTNLTILLS